MPDEDTAVGTVPPVLAAAPEVPGGAIELGGQPVVAQPREVLFRYQGKAFTIPVAFEIGDNLTYVHLGRKFGPDIAADWAMELALGEEGYRVFRSVRGLTDSQTDAVVALVTARVAGVQVPKA